MEASLTISLTEPQALILIDLVGQSAKHQGQGGLKHIKELCALHDSILKQTGLEDKRS